MDNLLTISGTRIARLIREGKISSREAVEIHIERICQVNPVLNAVVAERFNQARREADMADELLKKKRDRAKLPPFFGVPCTIKECFALTGMPNTAGIKNRRGLIPETDATAVARLRQAGAIPLGVTNTSEGCMWMESSNPVYGRTNNPYNPSHIVGGSSGGEGAIIGAGGSPFGLGSDIGGSIRMPAFFNGVFGHKPSGGLTPGTGQYPLATGAALRFLTTGPLSRRAEDLRPLLAVLAGPDGQDAGCVPMAIGDPAAVSFRNRVVLIVEDNGAIPVADDLRAAQRRAADALEKRGAKVLSAGIDSLKDSFNIWSAMLSEASVHSFSEVLGGDRPIAPLREMAKWVVRRSDHTLPALLLSVMEGLPKLTPGRTRRYAAQGRELKSELVDRLGPEGLLLYPPYPTAAPKHYKPMWPPFNWVYTAIWNTMEMPVTQIPMGLNEQGLPVGVQAAAAHGNDHLTIAAALAIEEDCGGWVMPGM